MVTAVLAETAEKAHEGGINPVAVGLLAFTVLMGMLFVVFAFRSVGTRH
ncbi:hypothetical protein [Demequina sp.]